MNSLKKTVRIMGLSLAILFFWGLGPSHADPAGPEWTDIRASDPMYDKEPHPGEQVSAGRAAMAAAEGVMKKIGIWKTFDRFKTKLRNQYSFELKKSFGQGAESGNDGGKTDEKDEEIVFSGVLGPEMTPILMFQSRFKPADFAIRFDALDQNMDLELSSRPVSRMTGGKTSLGLSSDGSDSQAVLKFAFEF